MWLLRFYIEYAFFYDIMVYMIPDIIQIKDVSKNERYNAK